MFGILPSLKDRMEFQLRNSGVSSPDLSSVLEEVGKTYPRLAQYLPNTVVQYGRAKTGDESHQLEFYPPWESENPNPGKITIELYNRLLKGQYLKNAVAGDLLHYLGAKNDGIPIDPTYWRLKQAVMEARTPQQRRLDERLYKQEGDKRTLQEWLDQSRIDAYIRGWVTPDVNDEWRKQGFYSQPDMKQAVTAIQEYLSKK